MKLLFQILDVLGALGLFIYSFFAILAGVTKTPVVAILVVLMIYCAFRLIVRVKKAE